MEHTIELRALLIDGSSKLDISLTERQLSQFSTYHRDLVIWNNKINLTAIKETKDIAVKHFIDSLAFAKAMRSISSEDSLLDIGTGAGFPGLPLKIFFPRLRVILLEPNHKKTAFLRHVIGTLELQNVDVLSKTLQDFAKKRECHGKFTYVTTRALDIYQDVEDIASLLDHGGRFILCRGKSCDIVSISNSKGLSPIKEIRYSLPYGAGSRVLTILEHVPRGTHKENSQHTKRGDQACPR